MRTDFPLSVPSPLAPDSLGYALDTAAQAVAAVRGGIALPAALAALHARIPSASVRGAVQDIAYRTLRALGCADALIVTLTRKAPPAHVANLLACAFALLLDEDDAGIGTTPYPAFTVVDQTVRAVGARRDFHFAKGLVNAVLRNFLRHRAALLDDVRQDPGAAWSYPAWWIDAVRRAWPDHWQALLAAGNTHAPLTLRVNQRRISTAAYLDLLRAADVDAVQTGPHAVQLSRPRPVDRIPGFADGLASVQDAGAQQAAPLLGVRDGMRVLDACAAPGGKTGHLLETADIELVALEADAARAARIDDNLARLGLRAAVTIGDAGMPAAWWDGRPFDRILADVPCSASGIVRRHPDVRWLRRAADIPALAAEQRRILAALWPLVAPGGELLYATCSIFPEEGEAQARWFESVQSDAVRLDAPGQLLPAVAGAGGALGPDHDGFFYARFQKR